MYVCAKFIKTRAGDSGSDFFKAKNHGALTYFHPENHRAKTIFGNQKFEGPEVIVNHKIIGQLSYNSCCYLFHLCWDLIAKTAKYHSFKAFL